MSSLYRVNYQLRPHARDSFIEFIKALLLPIHVLRDTNMKIQLYSTCKSIEELIAEHRRLEKLGLGKTSRLTALVPAIGYFHTELPIADAFLEYDNQCRLSNRYHIPPSFNDIRHILNLAQTKAISKQLKLVTFDGDQTLYADGDNFRKDSLLMDLIVKLLKGGKYVAIVTAAGYAYNPERYEQRLCGLLQGMIGHKLTEEEVSRFLVLGGECNYMFHCNTKGRLHIVEDDDFYSSEMKAWTEDEIKKLIEVSISCLEDAIAELNLPARIIRKDRAVGLVRKTSESIMSREQLDECALRVQKRLMDEVNIPFCAFNGGSDVWVDVGNKLIGVQVLQKWLGCESNQTLHVGDQFLSTGNDVMTRTACATAWIQTPVETERLLEKLLNYMYN